MLRNILTDSRESLLNLSVEDRDIIKRTLQEFYKWIQQIEEFEIKGDNPGTAHTTLVQNIFGFYDSAKKPLGGILAFLSSRKVDQA